MNPLEIAFATETDDAIKTGVAINHLVDVGRQTGGDYTITGQLEGGLFVHVNVQITKSKIPPQEVNKK